MRDPDKERPIIEAARRGSESAMAEIIDGHEHLIRKAVIPAVRLEVLPEEDLVQIGRLALALVVTTTWEPGTILWRQSRRQVIRAGFEEIARSIGTSERTLRRVSDAIKECNGDIAAARDYAANYADERVTEATFDMIQSAIKSDSMLVDDVYDMSREVSGTKLHHRETNPSAQEMVTAPDRRDPLTIELMERVSNASHVLDDRDRFVLSQYYGLGSEPNTDREIGGMLGIDRSRVSQIRREAIAKLQAEITNPKETP